MNYKKNLSKTNNMEVINNSIHANIKFIKIVYAMLIILSNSNIKISSTNSSTNMNSLVNNAMY